MALPSLRTRQPEPYNAGVAQLFMEVEAGLSMLFAARQSPYPDQQRSYLASAQDTYETARRFRALVEANDPETGRLGGLLRQLRDEILDFGQPS